MNTLNKENLCSLCGAGMDGWLCHNCFLRGGLGLRLPPELTMYGIHPNDTLKCVARGHKNCICGNPELKEYRDVKVPIYSTCGEYLMGKIDKPCCSACPTCKCHE